MPSRSAARHIDIEKGAPHQEVRRFGRDILGELGEPLRRDHARQPALAPAAHQIGHRAERHAPRFLADIAGGGGREQLRLVHHHQRREPLVARRIEQAVEEGAGAAQLRIDLQPLQVEDHRDAMLTHARGDAGGLVFGIIGGLDHLVAEFLRERDEIALGIDHHLLDIARALLEQPAQQVRLARPRIALHQQAAGQQFFQVELCARGAGRCAHVDVGGHGRACAGANPVCAIEV
jgi:hypothetical protein